MNSKNQKNAGADKYVEGKTQAETVVQIKSYNWWTWPELSMFKSAVICVVGKDRNGTTEATHPTREMAVQSIWSGKQLQEIVQACEQVFSWLTHPL